MENEFYNRRSSGSMCGNMDLEDDDPVLAFENDFEIGNYDHRSELKRTSLEKPDKLITPDLFELDLSGLNSTLSKGYLKKQKNQHDSNNVQFVTVGVRVKDLTMVPTKLRLSMTYSRAPPLSWVKDFEIQSKSGFFVCNIRLDPAEIYEKIYKSLSRNTHLSDEDRKLRINFHLVFFDNIDPRKSCMVIRLNQKSVPFFVCSWRKAVGIRKERENRQQSEDLCNRMEKRCSLVQVHPPTGSLSQPVSIYLRCDEEPAYKLLESIFSQRRKRGMKSSPMLCVYFGPNLGQICSAMRETMHPRFKGLFRIVCLVPSMTNETKSSVFVTVGLKKGNNSSGNSTDFLRFRGQVRFQISPIFQMQSFSGGRRFNQQSPRNMLQRNIVPPPTNQPYQRRRKMPPHTQNMIRYPRNNNNNGSQQQQHSMNYNNNNLVPPPPTSSGFQNNNQQPMGGNNRMMRSRNSMGGGTRRRPAQPPMRN